MTNASIQLEPARDAIAYAAARRLFSDYAAWLGVDLSFQGFEAELAGLPGKYAPPEADAAGGELIVAWRDAEDGSREAVGCVAVRPFADDACEMKRLFVRPVHRGQGLGRRLATQIIHEAITLDYTVMRLDTLDGGD